MFIGVSKKELFKFIVLITIVFFFIRFINDHYVELYQISKISFNEFCIIFLLSSLMLIPLGLTFYYSMLIFGFKLHVREWFGLSVVNSFYNMFLPLSSGVLFRAYYVKKEYGMSYFSYTSLMVVSLLCTFLSSSIISSVFIGYEYFFYGLFDRYLALLSFLMLFISFVFVFFFVRYNYQIKMPNLRYGLNLKLDLFFSGFYLMYKQQHIVLYMVLNFIVFSMIMSVKLYFAFYFLGFYVDFSKVIIIQSLSTFLLIFSITPGNIGVREGVIGFLSLYAGISFETAVVAATLDRIFNILVVLLFGALFNSIFMRKNALN